MTNVIFYVNMENRLQFFYSLLSRKILPRKWRVLVGVADEAEAERVNRYLWTAEAGGFLPHARIEDDAAAESPVVIAIGEPGADFQADALVWWQAEPPSFFGRFENLIELAERREVAAARERYKHYQERGYPVTIHDLPKIQKNRR